MSATIDTSYMRLTSVLKEWMEQKEWPDKLEINDQRDFGKVFAYYMMGHQKYQVHIEANELSECFDIYLYTPFNVPPARMADLTRILNRINLRLGLGRFCCLDDEDANPVQYKVAIDVDAAPFAPEHIDNIMDAAVNICDRYNQLLTSVALTDTSADAAWSKFVDEEDDE